MSRILTRNFSSSSSKRSAADYNRFLTPMSLRREPSAIRSLMPLLKIPGMISLGGGLPNGNMFPFKSLSFSLSDGTVIDLTPDELAEALQYSPTPGLPRLVDHLYRLQAREHNRSMQDCSLIVTQGSQDALTRAFEMLLEGPEDALLLENPTYSGALSFLQPLRCNLLQVPTDGEGIIPSALEDILKTNKGKPRIKALYTIPTGQNPGGSTCPVERRKKIYELACKYDFLILEDDPYFFLYYGPDPAPADDSAFNRKTIQSYWSMDTDNRVIRFDSFSKALSSGVRLGMATGPTALIDCMALHVQATTLHASGASQVLVSRLLDEWQAEGWNAHVRNVQLFYLKRRDMFNALALKHLKDLAQWTLPSAGMFFWFKPHGIDDSFSLIKEKAVAAKVLLVPGQAFMPDRSKSPFVRAAFSTATEAEMDEALGRFASLLKNIKSAL